MALSRQINQYKQNSVFTATPEELTLMLYNGVIKFIKQAEFYMEQGALDKSNESSQRAQSIIRELMSTLNMKYAIADNLMNLYTFFLQRLIEANTKKDRAIFLEVKNFVEELRDTWMEAMKIARIQQAKIDRNKAEV
jgi:flagellar protein FliS